MSRLINDDALKKSMREETLFNRWQMVLIEKVIDDQPTVEPTLYGYKIEHLALIARVMEKDGVTPETAVEIFKDVQTIALKVIDEICGAVERAFEQLTETGGSGDDTAD